MKNLHAVQSELPATTTLVAITKTFPFSAAAEAYALGVRHFGENRAEEAQSKIEEARARGFVDIVWHMVGHVQSRKAMDTVRLFDWIDSVDSMELLRNIDRVARKFGKKMHVLLEVNLSGEKGKYGFDLFGWDTDPTKIKNSHILIYENLGLGNVIIEGLMTMPPQVINAEHNRAIFRSMKKLSETIRAQIPGFGRELSMGTSQDYPVAIEEGATQIRLGEAIFGKRK